MAKKRGKGSSKRLKSKAGSSKASSGSKKGSSKGRKKKGTGSKKSGPSKAKKAEPKAGSEGIVKDEPEETHPKEDAKEIYATTQTEATLLDKVSEDPDLSTAETGDEDMSDTSPDEDSTKEEPAGADIEEGIQQVAVDQEPAEEQSQTEVPNIPPPPKESQSFGERDTSGLSAKPPPPPPSRR